MILETMNFSSHLEMVNELLDSAQTNVTCWGTRVVEVNEIAGSTAVFSLDDLAERVLQVASKRCESDDLTLQERIAGMEIAEKLRNFYRLIDEQISLSNCFTKLLNWIREFFFSLNPYTTRFYVEETLKNDFQAYSIGKFTQQFGTTSSKIDVHPAYDGEFGPPSRVIAREQSIRNLLGAV